MEEAKNITKNFSTYFVKRKLKNETPEQATNVTADVTTNVTGVSGGIDLKMGGGVSPFQSSFGATKDA